MNLESFLDWIARRRAKESMAAIGRSLGVKRQCVYRWMSGESQPSETVILLADHVAKQRSSQMGRSEVEG